MEIRGKNAIVTGAASGIGRATALMLARRGAAKIAIADIDEQRLDGLSAEIQALGAAPFPLGIDLRSSEDTIAMFRRAEVDLRGLDIIHNNAGVMGGPPDFPDTRLDKMISAIQINLIAMMLGTSLGIEFMRARGSPGVIINTSSTAGLGVLPQDPAYAASKHGILAFTQSCKPLQEAYGVRVMAICPAITDTAIVAKDAPWLKPILSMIRILHPDEIAAEVCRIIEDDSLAGEYVTVQNEPVAPAQ